jgi:hypothetical protein
VRGAVEPSIQVTEIGHHGPARPPSTIPALAADLGFNEPTIACLLGHKTHSITSRYVHSADAVQMTTICDCIAAHRWRSGGLHPFDVRRLDEFDATIGGHHLPKAREAWGSWRRRRGHGLAPSTCWLPWPMAPMSLGSLCRPCQPSLPAVRGAVGERIACPTPQQEPRLLAWCYARAACSAGGATARLAVSGLPAPVR